MSESQLYGSSTSQCPTDDEFKQSGISSLLESDNILAFIIVLLSIAIYVSKSVDWKFGNGAQNSISIACQEQQRDFLEKMISTNKNCIIFYGSQSGTAEDYANRLAKEAKSLYNLEAMVADLEDYDFDNLSNITEDKVIVFVLATYGEGDPTDNAVGFHEFLTSHDVDADTASPTLESLRYAIFGLGNSTYEHYNKMARVTDHTLQKLGASRIGQVGEGNDGVGTMEEDFLSWKDPMWVSLAETMNLELQQTESIYELAFKIMEQSNLSKDSPEVYHGEPNKMHLEGASQAPFHSQNPYMAAVGTARDLSKTPDKPCLHIDIDITGSQLSYQTGDHIAIWPVNPDKEVTKFLTILGLEQKRGTVISIEAVDTTTKVPFPTPTTYEAAARHYLDICGPVSRQFLSSLAMFAPTEAARSLATELGGNRDHFQEAIITRHHSTADALEFVSEGVTWDSIPFSAIIEGLTRLQPRYYSISSSALAQPHTVSVTAAVETKFLANRADCFFGVASNYLLAVKQQCNDDSGRENTHQLSIPRMQHSEPFLMVYLRQSNFRLPPDSTKPVILIGPGTGVAPMRAFVQERAHIVQSGATVGRTLLFFGCRKRDQDFLYEEEWKEYKRILGEKFDIVTAFSRATTTKVYVQHKLLEHALEVNKLMEQGAHVYVCGDATNMARGVKSTLAQILSAQRGIVPQKADNLLKSMKAAGKYQEDVW